MNLEFQNNLKLFLKTYRNFIIFGLILFVGSILFMIKGGAIDIAITNAFYNSNLPLGERFFLADYQPWKFLNEQNDYFEYFLYLTLIPMILVGLVALIVKKKWKVLLRYGLYAFCSAVFGAGIVVNLIFKDLWGRPRPRQTNLWPNSPNAENLKWYSLWDPVFIKDSSLVGVGKSFPSGHVALLAIYIVFFFIFMHPILWANLFKGGNEKKKIIIFSVFKWLGFAMSIIVGILTGFARIIVGAHHASDVLWSFGMVYIVNAIFYYWIFQMPKFEKKLILEHNFPIDVLK
ncbi:MAG: phosphatase PAP2 family protein [Promethearchaeota archaeon]